MIAIQDVAMTPTVTVCILGLMEWFEAADKRRESLGITHEDIAKELGLSRGAVSHYFRGRNQPSIAHLRKIAQMLKWSIEDLLSGDPDRPSVRNSLQLGEPEHVYVGGTNGEEMWSINRVVGAKLAAGTGEVFWEADEVEKSFSFRRDWMQRKGLTPERCKVWAIRGDSMEPKYASGDVLLIDMADRERRHGKIYALVGDEGLRVKQLLRTESGWTMRSFNQDKTRYPDEPIVEGNVAILGRVRGHAGDDD